MFGYIYLRYPRGSFPYLLEGMDDDIAVFDDTATSENCSKLSGKVGEEFVKRGLPDTVRNQAEVLIEEIIKAIIEVNRGGKSPPFIEISLTFKKDSVMIVIRDSGVLCDLTDPDLNVKSLGVYTLSRLMSFCPNKAYLTTTGYNRNMIQLSI